MTKSDVSASSPARLAKNASENTIEFQLENELPGNVSSVTRVKNVTKFLGLDPTKYKIIGHHEILSHNGGVSHLKGTFTIREKQTKKVQQLVADFVRKSNETEYTGVVTSVVSEQKKSSGSLSILIGTKVIMNELKRKDVPTFFYRWGLAPFQMRA